MENARNAYLVLVWLWAVLFRVMQQIYICICNLDPFRGFTFIRWWMEIITVHIEHIEFILWMVFPRICQLFAKDWPQRSTQNARSVYIMFSFGSNEFKINENRVMLFELHKFTSTLRKYMNTTHNQIIFPENMIPPFVTIFAVTMILIWLQYKISVSKLIGLTIIHNT